MSDSRPGTKVVINDPEYPLKELKPDAPIHMPSCDEKCEHQHTAPISGRIWCVDCGGEVTNES